MGVAHDLALLDRAVLSEEASNLLFRQAGVDASNEQVGTRVDGTVIVLGIILGGATVGGKR